MRLLGLFVCGVAAAIASGGGHRTACAVFVVGGALNATVTLSILIFNELRGR